MYTHSKNTVSNRHTHKMSHSVSSSCQGPQHHPWVSTCDGSSPEISRRCTVVPVEFVKPHVPREAWASLLTWVWKATKWHWCDTPKFGGQVRSQEVWLRVQRVSCADGRLDPAQDRDRSERRRLHSAHGTATCGRPVKSRSYKHMSRLARQECAHAQYVSIKCLWQSTEYSLQF